MAFYTKKGDNGDTGIFGCDQRISKSSAITEALGSLDETNSFLGVCKVKAELADGKINGSPYDGSPTSIKAYDGSRASIIEVLGGVQQNLFIIQAEVAGGDKKISEEKIKEIEDVIDEIEKELPEIKSFFVSGGTELSASLDFARTLARRAERRVIAVSEEGKVEISKNTFAFLNRLSSLLYALARLVNHKFGIKEQSPHY